MKGPGIGVGLELGANRIGTATVSRFVGWTRYYQPRTAIRVTLLIALAILHITISEATPGSWESPNNSMRR
jgi:hypothetical protein